MVTKKDDAANSDDVTSADNKKTSKIRKKLKSMGVMPSAKKPSEATESTESGSHLISSVLMALVVAIPVAAIVAYIVVPNQLSALLSSENSRLSAITDDATSNAFQARSTDNWNRNQQPEWVTQHRADMEKRRAEFDKQNADNYVSNRNSSKPPQWVNDRQAQMEKRRAEFEKQNAAHYAANRNPSEVPQWVKDQQALMQKEQARYQQEWSNRSANAPYNAAGQFPGYMNSPINTYQQPNQAPVNAYAQNPGQYYNGYPQPINPYQYNNGQYYAPYNVPNGQYGYPYR